MLGKLSFSYVKIYFDYYIKQKNINYLNFTNKLLFGIVFLPDLIYLKVNAN